MMNDRTVRLSAPPLKSLLGLTSFYIVVGRLALRPQNMEDPDIWWHLRTGQWIIEHHALPLTDPFSQIGQTQPWIPYSWLFEVMLHYLHQTWGLAGILGFTVTLSLAIAAALLALVHQQVPSLQRALLFVTPGLIALAPLCTPRSWLFTLLFFILEYVLLRAARQPGKSHLRWWLLPLFALWANLHIQFVYGLFLLVFDAAQPWLEQWLQGNFSWAEFRRHFVWEQWGCVLACGAATLLTPFHFKLYRVIWELAEQGGVYQYINELRPMSFNSYSAWFVLALAFGAVFRMGWQRVPQRSLFLLLLVSLTLAFRSTRDLWFPVVISLVILTAPATAASEEAPLYSWQWHPAAWALAGLMLLFVGRQSQFSNQALESVVAQHYPVAATNFIQRQNYQGPLFNHFDWGGYLIWRLPALPVSMDGRTNIYGPARLARHTATWGGKGTWAQDAELSSANLVLADLNQPLCELLRHDQRFELVYEDKLAALFKARPQPLAQQMKGQP